MDSLASCRWVQLEPEPPSGPASLEAHRAASPGQFSSAGAGTQNRATHLPRGLPKSMSTCHSHAQELPVNLSTCGAPCMLLATHGALPQPPAYPSLT